MASFLCGHLLCVAAKQETKEVGRKILTGKLKSPSFGVLRRKTLSREKEAYIKHRLKMQRDRDLPGSQSKGQDGKAQRRGYITDGLSLVANQPGHSLMSNRSM